MFLFAMMQSQPDKRFWSNTSLVKKQSLQLWPIGTQYSSVHRMPNIALHTLGDPPYPSLPSLSIFSVSAFPPTKTGAAAGQSD